MSQVRRRPFYAEFAWAFDLLIDRPVQKECAVIVAWLADRGIFPGATLLDAGCGTGRYAVELARRGDVVTGIDRSPDLIDVAKAARAGARSRVSFDVGEITDLPVAPYDVILCRGVLNDPTSRLARPIASWRWRTASDRSSRFCPWLASPSSPIPSSTV